MNQHAPGLREHLAHKRAAMVAAAAAAPSMEDWEERIGAVCEADPATGVRKLDVRGWRYISDGGPAIGGSDLGPSSPELFCGVVSTCFTHTLLCLAAAQEVPLDEVAVEVSAINNDANFFGVASTLGWVPRDLTVTARIIARGVPRATIDALAEEAGRTCPILQLVRGQNEVTVELVGED